MPTDGGASLATAAIGHVVLPSCDPEASAKFYEDHLGMQRIAYLARSRMTFLSFGRLHHDIALVEVAADELPRGSGHAHTGIHIDGGTERLGELREHLVRRGVEVGEVHDYGFMHGFYLRDLDGNGLEIFCDVMAERDAIEALRAKSVDRPAQRPPVPSSRTRSSGSSNRGT